MRRQEIYLAKVAVRGVDLEPIDRLEEKVKLLVGMIDRLRADQARAADENARLTRELDTMNVLRDLIRSRVGEMLTQIETLNL